MNPMIWLILFIIFIVFELITLGLTTIWFAGGALVAYISYLAGANEVVQIVLFFVVSIALLISTRPFAKKYINKMTTKTNVEAMAGKTGKVIKEINNINATGRVLIEGEEWMARSFDDKVVIGKDELVTVMAVKGVKVIVKIKEEK